MKYLRPQAPVLSHAFRTPQKNNLHFGSDKKTSDPERLISMHSEIDYCVALPLDIRKRAEAFLDLIDETKELAQEYPEYSCIGFSNENKKVQLANYAESMRDDLEKTIAQTEHEINQALIKLSPKSSHLLLSYIPHGLIVIPNIMMGAGLDKAAWVLAVGSSGTDNSPQNIQKYIDQCARWVSAWTLREIAQEHAREMINIEQIAFNERLRKFGSLEGRIPVISRKISLAIGKAVDIKQGHLESQDSMMNQVDEMFKWISKLASDWSWWEDPAGPTPVLAARNSIKAGQFSGASFDHLFLSDDNEKWPFVDFQKYIVAASPRHVAQFFETTLLGHIEQNLRLDKGEIFEIAVRVLVQESCGGGMNVHEEDVEICGNTDLKWHETDLLFYCNDLLVVGEVKSYKASAKPTSVTASFETEISKAITQVKTRVDAIEDGGSWRPKKTTNDKPLIFKKCRGFVVSLHGYGSSVWDVNVMLQIHGVNTPPVLPVHALVLILSMCSTPDDFTRYLVRREYAVKRGVAALDETEYIEWLFGSHFQPANSEWHGRILLNPKMMTHALGSIFDFDQIPKGIRWKEFVLNNIIPVP